MSYISFQPKDYFKTKLYTGTGSSNAITGVGFQPDWTWIKERSGAAHDHNLTDAVRGVTKTIRTNTSQAQTTDAQDLKTFDSDGFTLGTNGGVNENNINFVSWNWKANGQGSSNTDGTINTTYTSANTTSGVSIIQYTGTGSNATIGHGLGVAPASVIIKRTSATGDWVIGNNGMGGWNYVLNFSTSPRANQNAQFQSTAPDANVITLGTDGQVNESGVTYICYAFSPITGFSQFDGYEGNGSADGTYVYTGFKPAFLMVKGATVTDNWSMFNNKTLGYNTFNYIIYPDLTNAESNGLPIDFLSNGFKWRNNAAMVNGSGQSYIYQAFAEQPLVASNGNAATAR